MFPTDELNEVLDGVVDTETEDALLVSGYGTRTWGIDWRNGRLFKADPVRTKAERVIKYLLTPRGQVEVYPSFGSDNLDEGYGSLIWTMFGEVYPDAETARADLQALCNEAALAVVGVEGVTAEEVTLKDDTLSARIRITIDTGEEVTVDDITIAN
ncbi:MULTISPECIES: hypothetical protein [unclassified Exiguobacterium]|uniref:hypothetical protein n=1 Tax=unclassified Exiguobacterium TaxID=2644629 RepID=UPI001BE7EB4A|nr:MULTISPECIES: hypothetical protein [unclassified Exiguobacterium]